MKLGLSLFIRALCLPIRHWATSKWVLIAYVLIALIIQFALGIDDGLGAWLDILALMLFLVFWHRAILLPPPAPWPSPGNVFLYFAVFIGVMVLGLIIASPVLSDPAAFSTPAVGPIVVMGLLALTVMGCVGIWTPAAALGRKLNVRASVRIGLRNIVPIFVTQVCLASFGLILTLPAMNSDGYYYRFDAYMNVLSIGIAVVSASLLTVLYRDVLPDMAEASQPQE